MKHDPKGPKEESKTYGLVSPYQLVPLFGENEESVTFAREVFDRREKEVLKCAKKAHFRLASKNRAQVRFVKENSSSVA